MCSTWQERRIVWNREKLYFSRPNENTIIDSIPLSEMTGISSVAHTIENRRAREGEKPVTNNEGRKIQESKDASSGLHLPEATFTFTDPIGFGPGSNENTATPSDDRVSAEAPRMKNALTEGENCLEIIQIKTIPEGFNSGRTYCLRTSRVGFCEAFCLEMTSKSKAARVRAEKLSRFQKNQAFLRKIYRSNPFQMFVSFLILAVRTCG